MTYGDQEICLLHINDVVNTLIVQYHFYLRLKAIKNTPFTDDSSTYKLKDLILQIKNILESKSKIELGFYPCRKNEIFRLTSKHFKLTGWRPSVNLKQGILETLKE